MNDMGAGRPSEYRESYADDVDLYLSTYEDRGEATPTKEGFAVFLGTTKPTILKWSKEHGEFLYALEKIEVKQAIALQSKGLKGEFNSTITKLMLSANHGMREGSDVTTNGKDLPSPILGGTSLNEVHTDNDRKEDIVAEETA
jgi:hypothetical protein